MAFLARLPQWKIDMSKKAEGKESKHEKAKLEMMEKLERELVTAEPEEDVQTELQPISTVHRLQVLAPGTIRAGLRVERRRTRWELDRASSLSATSNSSVKEEKIVPSIVQLSIINYCQ